MTAAASMADGPEIRAADLGLRPPPRTDGGPDFSRYTGLPLTDAKTRLVEDFERAMIVSALEASRRPGA